MPLTAAPKPLDERSRLDRAAAFRWYLARYLDHRTHVIVGVVGSLLTSFFALPMIPLLARLVDHALPKGSRSSLFRCIAGIVFVTTVGQACRVVVRRHTLRTGKAIVAGIRNEIADRLLDLPVTAIEGLQSARFQQILAEDSERVDEMTDLALTTIVPSVAMTIGLSIVLMTRSPSLTAVLVGCVVVVALGVRSLRRSVHQRALRFRDANGHLLAEALTLVQLARLIRLQSAEDQHRRSATEAIDRLRNDGFEVAWISTMQSSAVEVALTLAIAAVLGVGGVQVINGELSLGTLLAFFVAARLLLANAQSVLGAVPRLGVGIASLGAIHRLVTGAVPGNREGTKTLTPFLGNIEIEDLAFSFDGRAPLFRGLNLTIAPGTVTVIHGSNGAGKTTLLSLVLGLLHPTAGVIRADGVAYRDLDLHDLRRQFGVVSQDALFLDASIRDAITHGTTDVVIEQVHAVLERAGLTSLIAELPQGLDTRIGEAGHLLSGGQRQRIAIARALIRSPALLILDEPTNHLDPSAVATLLESIRSANPSPTVLIVSHDVVMQQVADRVLAFDDGRLTELVTMKAHTQ